MAESRMPVAEPGRNLGSSFGSQGCGKADEDPLRKGLLKGRGRDISEIRESGIIPAAPLAPNQSSLRVFKERFATAVPARPAVIGQQSGLVTFENMFTKIKFPVNPLRVLANFYSCWFGFGFGFRFGFEDSALTMTLAKLSLACTLSRSCRIFSKLT